MIITVRDPSCSRQADTFPPQLIRRSRPGPRRGRRTSLTGFPPASSTPFFTPGVFRYPVQQGQLVDNGIRCLARGQPFIAPAGDVCACEADQGAVPQGVPPFPAGQAVSFLLAALVVWGDILAVRLADVAQGQASGGLPLLALPGDCVAALGPQAGEGIGTPFLRVF